MITKSGLNEQVYDEIRELILQRKIDIDERYSAKWFAEHLGVSRTPVREALLQLQEEGLIEIMPNYGVRVRTLSAKDAMDLYQTRVAIDGYCARYMAMRIGEQEAQRVADRMEALIEKCDRNFNQKDELQFHVEAIEYTGNVEFLKIYHRLRARQDVFWKEIIGSSGTRHGEVYREHWKILKAIRSGNADLSYSAVEEHLLNAYSRFFGNP